MPHSHRAHRSVPRGQTRFRGARRWVGAAFCLFLLGLTLTAPGAQAKVRPYYVLESAAYGRPNLRVLIAFDTSSSMGVVLDPAERAAAGPYGCGWNECETAGHARESAMSVARRAMRTVISELSDSAEFAVMGFAVNTTPLPNAAPAKCSTAYGVRRFMWMRAQQSSTTWNLAKYPGLVGAWALCADWVNAHPNIPVDPQIRPYPYLRWDRLGVGSVISSRVSTGPVPSSPLISTAAGAMDSTYNATRLVQWFPRFMGVRANLNDASDPGERILSRTVGDWGSSANPSARRTNVKGHDFYYWPYVDGFVGYRSGWNGIPDGSRGYSVSRWRGGAMSAPAGPYSSGTLWAPFFLEPTEVAGKPIAATAMGPQSAQDALDVALAVTGPQIEGGVDPVSPLGTWSRTGLWHTTVGEPGADPIRYDNDFVQATTVTNYVEFLRDLNAGVCRPMAAVFITDGFIANTPETFSAVARLRRTLGVKTYVVGMLLSGVGASHNELACAAAGACDGVCSTPCDDSPVAAWDTCADPLNPTAACSFVVTNGAELADAMRDAIGRGLEAQLSAGPTSAVNHFVAAGSSTEVVQTTLRAYTEFPGWKGHVERELCSDLVGGAPAPWCRAPASAPDIRTTFGSSCPPSWTWDAGDCTLGWRWRRLFTHDENNNLIRVLDPGPMTASVGFSALLQRMGLVSGPSAASDATAIAQFIQGRAWPDAWSIPGVANASPTVVRRIPARERDAIVELPPLDPHCAGRLVDRAQPPSLPQTLLDFSDDAWSTSVNYAGVPAREYQEAVLMGDDLGMIHAFQLGSGAEMWGLIPRFALPGATRQWQNGAAKRGQPDRIADHEFGVAATLNQGWAYDTAAGRWRHLGVIGMGIGGTEILVLDLSHMHPFGRVAGRPKCATSGTSSSSAVCPVEVLWTTEDAPHKASYDVRLGQTWARPALGYSVPNHDPAREPVAHLLIGGGYKAPQYAETSAQGRVVLRVDALTGSIAETATLTRPSRTYDSDFGQLADLAVTSQCRSGYWAEIDEVYFADPGGRLFRWDLEGLSQPDLRVSDSWTQWHQSDPVHDQAFALAHLWACRGTGNGCTTDVDPATRMREPFHLPIAVTANNRIDDAASFGGNDEEFLIAAISGSPNDDATDGGAPGASFHSSLYLLVDDHRVSQHRGLNIPSGQPAFTTTADLTTYAHFAKVPLSRIWRRRTFTPFPGAPSYAESKKFGRAARPVRAPRIQVEGVVDGNGEWVDGVEVYNVTFTVYDPGLAQCDARFYDAATGTWHKDWGATWELNFRLTADSGDFDFRTGSGRPDVDFGTLERGLAFLGAKQIGDGCPSGNCAPQNGDVGARPCETDVATMPPAPARTTLSLSQTHIAGYSPSEG